MFQDSSIRGDVIGRGRLRIAVSVILGTCLILQGCSERSTVVSQSAAVSNSSASADAGTLVMIPGIVGQVSDLVGMRDGLIDSGCPYRIEIIPWETSAFQPIKNLTDYQANVERATRIADRITQLRRNCPSRPLVLLGNSGGGGLAILAVEMLPDDVVLDQLILTAAAVSNDYDLTRVRARCRSIVSFYSRSDGIVGWGTSLFGTIDRKNTLSAGHCGFLTPEGTLRWDAGLVQVEYQPEWVRFGHDGSHLGYRSRRWAEVVLSSWLMNSAGIASADSIRAPEALDTSASAIESPTAAAY